MKKSKRTTGKRQPRRRRSKKKESKTENAALVNDLLANLDERGLKLTSRTLLIIDGSKVLSSAVRKTFGRQAAVQRCIHHKYQNVVS